MVLHKIRQRRDDTFHDIVQGWAAATATARGHRRLHGLREKSAPDADFGPIWKDWLYGGGSRHARERRLSRRRGIVQLGKQ